MNSLSELNSFAVTSISSTDNRTADLTFDKPTSSNASVSIDFTAGGPGTHTVPVGINIREIIRADVCLPTYTIDLSGASGNATLAWPTLPSGVTSSTPSANVYRVSGFSTIAHWNTVKSPTITVDSNYAGSFTYTATIRWNTTETVTWTVSVSAENISIISVARSSDTYTANTTTTITGGPLITDAAYDGSGAYTMTVVPNPTGAVTTLSSSGRSEYTVSQTLNDPDSPDNGTYDDGAITANGTYAVVGKPTSDTPFNGEINVYTGSSGTYTYQTTLQPSGVSNNTQNIGSAVALDSDATRLVTSSSYRGYTFVFKRTGTSWAQESNIQTDLINASGGANQLVLSSTGDTILQSENGNIQNITGRVKSYTRSGTTWSLEASNIVTTDVFNTDYFGGAIAASSDCNTLAVAASSYNNRYQSSSITGGSISTAQNKFGTASLYLNNTLGATATNYMLLPDPDGNGFYQWGDYPDNLDGCVEMWFRTTSSISDQYLFRMPNGSALDGLTINSGVLKYRKGGSIRITGSTGMASNTWHHVALVFKSNGDHKLFLNGVQQGSTWAGGSQGAYAFVSTGNPLIIGATKTSGGAFTQGLNGYIDEVRISKGVVRYDSTFSVATAAFTEDQYTLGLAHFNETNGATTTTGLGITLNVGAVYVFTRTSGTWTQQAKIQAGDLSAGDNFGQALNMSTNGNTLYITSDTGTYIYTRSGSTWTQASKQAFTIAHGCVNSDETFAISGTTVYKKISGVWTNYGTVSGTAFGITTDGSRVLSRSTANLVVNAQATVGSSWNSGTKTLTLTGTRAQINADVDTIQLTPYGGYTSNFQLVYTATTPRSATDDRSQDIIYTT
jgi:hypothetical protein